MPRKKRQKRQTIHQVTPPPASDHPQRKEVISHPLTIALSAAVPLQILQFYERGSVEPWEIEEARAFGHVLASQGDKLLYGGNKEGETADLFAGLAKAIAVLAFQPGGVPVFGHSFDAQQLLTHFFGSDAASTFCQAVIERYDAALVTGISALCRLPNQEAVIGTWNVLPWFERASDADLLQLRREGYSNLLQEGPDERIYENSIAAQIVQDEIVRQAERLLARGPESAGADTDEQRRQALQVIEARKCGQAQVCCIEREQAEQWLTVFRHRLVTGEQFSS